MPISPKNWVEPRDLESRPSKDSFLFLLGRDFYLINKFRGIEY